MKEFKDTLAAWVGEKGLVEAALQLGVSTGTAWNWLNGVCLPPGSRIPLLAGHLGIDESVLRADLTAEREARRLAATQGK